MGSQVGVAFVDASFKMPLQGIALAKWDMEGCDISKTRLLQSNAFTLLGNVD